MVSTTNFCVKGMARLLKECWEIESWEKCNSMREMWRVSIYGTFSFSFSIMSGVKFTTVCYVYF